MRSGSLLPPVALLIGGFMFVWIPHVGAPTIFSGRRRDEFGIDKGAINTGAYFVDCSIGNSPGLAPLKILST
jgi:hypothetical protein